MYIALYEAVCKMQEKINELVDRVNSFDPTASTDYVKTVNGLKGTVKLTGDNIPYNQLKSINRQITDNVNEIQTVKQNITDLIPVFEWWVSLIRGIQKYKRYTCRTRTRHTSLSPLKKKSSEAAFLA